MSLPIVAAALLNLPSLDNRSIALYAEARNKSCSDYAPTDLVYKISRDLGATWSSLSILCTDGCTDHGAARDQTHSRPQPSTAVRTQTSSLLTRFPFMFARRPRLLQLDCAAVADRRAGG